MVKQKTRDYEALVAGMRHKPTIFDMDEEMRKGFYSKPPDYRWLAMWNSPELGSFRGIEENMKQLEENRERYTLQQEEMKRLGREQGVNQPDLQHVSEALWAQQKQMGVLQQAQAASDENHRQAQVARDKELAAHMETLARESRTAAEHARLAAEVSARHNDVLLADRDRLASIAQNAGVSHTSIDNSVVNHNVVNNNLLDQSIHNQVAMMMRSHSEQMGQYMQQQRLSQEQMMNLLFLHLKRHQPEPVIQILGSGGGPPPPPGAGAVVVRERRGGRQRQGPYEAPPQTTSDTKPPPPPPPAPQAVAALPAPAPPPKIEHTLANKPPPPAPPPGPGAAPRARAARSRSRARMVEDVEEIPVPKRRGRPPGSKNKPKGPEQYALTDTEEIPVPKPRGRSVPKKDEQEVIPVPKARAKSRAKKPAEDVEVVPVPKAKAKARARTLSVKPMGDEEVIPGPPVVKKPRGRPKAAPSQEPPEVIPQLEQTKKTPGGRKGRVSLVKIAADIGGDAGVPEVSAKVAKKTPGRKVPTAAPEMRKTPAKKVDLTSVNKDGTMKKKRGRPPGSKNKPKAALVDTVAALKA